MQVLAAEVPAGIHRGEEWGDRSGHEYYLLQLLNTKICPIVLIDRKMQIKITDIIGPHNIGNYKEE